jgi:hypothetical protein
MQPLSVSNPNALKSLAEAIKKDGKGVLLVIGAGVSIGATGLPRASWAGLLQHGIDWLAREARVGHVDEISEDLSAAFHPFNREKALESADYVEINLKPGNGRLLAKWLAEAFDPEQFMAKDKEVLEAIDQLRRSGALIMTTNYDDLLSEVTGLPPVTVRPPGTLFQVIQGERHGIIHIHGHWSDPGSIVLGNNTYGRVVNDKSLQALLKALWLTRTLVYIGCGSGLDDPNVGALLEWGKEWSDGAATSPNHYFIAHRDTTRELESRAERPKHLIGYDNHADLPEILRSLIPKVRSGPFTRIDAAFYKFRSDNSKLPFPSWREFVEGEVPALQADAEVRQRLKSHRWAFVRDTVSLGKTTMSLRIATGPDRLPFPTYYIDLAYEKQDDILAAFERLVSDHTLFVIDNIHHQPEIAHRLFKEGIEVRGQGLIILIASTTDMVSRANASQDLAFLQPDTLPAVKLSYEPDDLWEIARYIHRRDTRNSSVVLPRPPIEVMQKWHRTYGRSISAFCLAVSDRLDYFQRGNWDLSPKAAARWVQDNWLDKLKRSAEENAVCLAVFASQFEMAIGPAALPHSDRRDIKPLRKVGLISQFSGASHGQPQTLTLGDQSWSHLILEATELQIDQEAVLFQAAGRDPRVAVALSARLRHAGRVDRLQALWAHIGGAAAPFLVKARDLQLSYLANLTSAAIDGGQASIADALWDAVEGEPEKIVELALEKPLQDFTFLLRTGKAQNRQLDALWSHLEAHSSRFIDSLWWRPLQDVGAFLKTTRTQGRNVEWLWRAIESHPEKVAERGWSTPLGHLGTFLQTAGREKASRLWSAIETRLDLVAERAWQTPLDHVGSFMKVAEEHGRDVARLWEAIESKPDRLAERAWQTPLDHIGSFMKVAEEHGRDVARLWEAIESKPDRLAERAWQTPLAHTALFMEMAGHQNRNLALLWDAIEAQPERLVQLAWESPLHDLSSFMRVARSHGRDLKLIWQALEQRPDEFANRAWVNSLPNTISLLSQAKDDGRSVDQLWSTLSADPDRLFENAMKAQPGAAVKAAVDLDLDVGALWSAIERRPREFAERAWRLPVDQVAGLLDIARRQGRPVESTDALWAAFEAQPERLVSLVAQVQISQLIHYLKLAKDNGRLLAPLFSRLERRLDWFSSMASTKDLASLASLIEQVPRDLALAILAKFDLDNWRPLPAWATTFPIIVFSRASKGVGRTDLSETMLQLLKEAGR